MRKIKKMQILRVPLPVFTPSRYLLKTSYAIITHFGVQFYAFNKVHVAKF